MLPIAATSTRALRLRCRDKAEAAIEQRLPPRSQHRSREACNWPSVPKVGEGTYGSVGADTTFHWNSVIARSCGTGLQARADAEGLITWDVSVDSTVSRAHQHAAGARTRPQLQKEPPGGVEPADHALGRSRGGLTTKLHLSCEQGQKPLSMLLTGGQRGDSPQFIPVLEGIRVPRLSDGRPRTRPDRVLADKAYTSHANRDYLRRRGIKATIPIKADQPRIAARRDRRADDPRASTRTSTSSATPWSAVSTPAQTPPRHRDAIQQTRRALPGHTPHRRDQRVALTQL
jgi:hypothetical protein